MGLVPTTLGKESSKNLSSGLDLLPVGSPVPEKSGDPGMDVDPQGDFEGVDWTDETDIGDVKAMYNAGCAGRVHPSLSFDVSVSEESDDVAWMGVIGRGDELSCAVGLADTSGKICDGGRGGGSIPGYPLMYLCQMISQAMFEGWVCWLHPHSRVLMSVEMQEDPNWDLATPLVQPRHQTSHHR